LGSAFCFSISNQQTDNQHFQVLLLFETGRDFEV